MKKFNVWRLLLQFSVLGWLVFLIIRVLVDSSYSVDFEAYCPMGGLQALSSYLVRGSLACSMTSVQIVMGLMLFVGVVLISKLFCAFICPLGTIMEWLGKLGDKLHVRVTVKGIADMILRVIKYVLLFVTFYFTVGASELFCKNYDPFFAAVSGYGHDVTTWMAVTSTLIVILGSVFVRMFWCKYICPLGAVSNIFKFLITFAAVFGVYFLLIYAGLEISWLWPLAITCILSYAFEVIYLKSNLFPAFKITRDENTCIDCGLCSKKCPQAIDVANLKVVKHIDCNLCGECLTACPKEGALTINKRFRSAMVPAIVTVLLVVLGIYIGSTMEVATIDEKWGTEQQIDNAKVFEKDGLKNIKCYGSSKAFAAKMKKVNGVLGVATYVKSHTAKIYYDPSLLNEEMIMKIIFTPSQLKIANPPREVENIKKVELGVENLFDKMDVNYLMMVFRQYEGYYGLISEYGCPVKITLFMDANKKFDKDELKKIVESEEYVFKAHNTEKHIELDFELVYAKELEGEVARPVFMQDFFKGFKNEYKKMQEKYKDNVHAVYEIPFPSAEKPIISRNFPYFSSHLSSIDGVLAFQIVLKDDDSVVMQISFAKDVIAEDALWERISSDKWHITYKDGSVKEESPKFGFKTKGKVLENS